MTWGFQATNTSGQVLVSSETRNLHFIGKARLDRIIKQFDGYGGLRHYAFRIACNVTPVPFFTMPTADFYGVASVRGVSAGVWEIEIIRSGTSANIPEVYVFADPRGTTARNTNYGMLVLRDDGTPSFDSRLSPLVVTGGTSVAPPSNPLATAPGSMEAKYCGSTVASSNFRPTNFNQYSLNPNSNKPMFFFSSVAQAQRDARFSASRRLCIGVSAYGNCIGYGEEEFWNSTYWGFYRAGIRYSGGILSCGWVCLEYGCNWTYEQGSQFLGIGLGDDSGTGGVWPYSNETLNLAPSGVITANALRYD